MATNWDDFTPVSEPGSSTNWDDFTPVDQPTAEIPTKKLSRTAAEIAQDVGVTALKGAVGLPQAAVGLLDIPTLGHAGKALESLGYRPNEAQAQLDGMYSEATQADKAYVGQADGFVDTLGRAIERPATIATAVGESIPQMLGGMGVARGLLKVAPKVAPWLAGAIGEGVLGAGGAAEQIRGETADGLLTPGQAAAAVGSGVGTAALGAAGGKLASRLGVGDIDTMLAQGAGKLSKSPVGFVKQVIGSGISEGVFEELPQSIQEQMWQNYATGKPLDEGVGNAAAMGLLAGAAMGGAGGGYNAAISSFQGEADTPMVAPTSPANTQPKAPVNIASAATNTVANAQTVGNADNTEADKKLREPVALTALDRANSIDTELGQIVAKRQQISDPADPALATLDAQAQALATERNDIAKSWPMAAMGATTSFSTETGSRLDGQYALMDAADLVTSHDENLRANPLYPAELQPRDRSRSASEMQVSGIVQKLDPARLGLSADAATGAPIVGADGLVESGNARTIALKRVYQANGQKAEDYKSFLRDNYSMFGIDPTKIETMASPVLVRVRSTPVNRAEFARQANASTVQRMSPSEQAVSDSKRLTNLDGLKPDDNGDFDTSYDFIRQFMGMMPVTEQSDMIESDGKLSTFGYRRIQNAVLAKAYGDSPTLRRMTESMDDNLRNITKALTRVAPVIAGARERIQAGTLHSADLGPDLIQAVDGLSALKDKGWSVSDELSQGDLAGAKYSPEAAQLLQFLNDNIRSPKRIAEFLQRYYEALEAAGDPNQGSIFGDSPAPSRTDLLTSAKGNTDDHTGPKPQPEPNRQGALPAGQDGQKREDAPGRGRSDQGDGPAGSAAVAGRAIATEGQDTSEWVNFPKDSGTIGIPRADMPQIKGEHRGALIQFLQGRGISHETKDMPASSLKPTQAEFSTKKAARWGEVRNDVDRSVLVSSDNHILDGHHQWIAAVAANEPVKAIVLDSPIRELMANVFQFPSVKQSEGSATSQGESSKARQEFKSAMADLADLLANTLGARAMMVPSDTPGLRPILVRLFTAAIEIVGTDLKAATRWVKAELKSGADTKKLWNKITDKEYQQAALEAMEASATQHVDDLFSAAEKRGQVDMFADAPAPVAKKADVAMLNGKPYDMERDNYKAQPANDFVSSAVLTAAQALIDKYFKGKPKSTISDADRAKAEAGLKPLLEAAAKDKASFDQSIINVAEKYGISQMIAPLKSIERAAEKVVIDYKGDASRIADLLRATVIVDRYEDAGNIIAALVERYGIDAVSKIKNKTGIKLDGLSEEVSAKLQEQDRLSFGGYSDVSLIVRTPSGVMAEVQINVPEIMAVKDAEGHKLYEAARTQPKDSEKEREIDAAMLQVYGECFEAAQARRLNATSLKNSASDRGNHWPTGPRGPMAGLSSSDLPSSDKANQDPLGNSTKNPPSVFSAKRQPGGNLSGNNIDTPFGSSVAQLPEYGYTQANKVGEQNGNDTNSPVGDQGQGADPVQGTSGQGATQSVRRGPRGPNQRGRGDADAGATAQGEMGPAGTSRVRGQDENGSQPEPGDHAGASAGIPAGRDIPAKSGLNYAFGDDDLTYEGSWPKKAVQNVDAVELVKKLATEGRQASRDEQKTLAKFTGWGAGELANNLFGPKLDKAAEALDSYNKAVQAWGSKTEVTNRSYSEFAPAFSVLHAKDPSLTWYNTGTITRKMLDAAKPDAATLRWLGLRDRLKAALTEAEWAEASRSTQYAHYTSKAIVKSMWRALDRMGFKGGSILEPGAGIGVFPGLMSPAMAANSIYTGIEFDGITGAILKQLYPDERILVESFVDTTLPKNFYDVPTGNPPFSGTKILGDPEYQKLALSLHDYFFAKSIDRVKPGGLVTFVTSRYTMDKLSDKARAYLAERADLVGAIRLPQTAFKQNAGTDVVTDVIFLRKKVAGENFEYAQPWMKTDTVSTPEGPAIINEYFAAHPEMVLGTHSMTGKMQNTAEPQYTVLALPGDIEAMFDKAVENLPSNIYKAGRGSSAEAAQVREIDFNPKAKKEGNYYVTDAGVLMQREGGVGELAKLKSAKDTELVKDFVPLRDALKQAHYDQLNNGDWEPSLAVLQKAYKAFTDTHGQINQFTTRAVKTKTVDEETGQEFDDVIEKRVPTLLKKLEDDPDWTLVAALENINDDTGVITASDFLTKRVLGKAAQTSAATPIDAMLSVLNDIGHVDIASIAHRLTMSEADTIEALGTSVYDDPESGWVVADDYLSGNVKEKLDSAREAAKADKRFERNITALEGAQPTPKNQSQINAAIGMNWIPGEVYQQFLKDTAKVEAKVEWNARTKQWIVQETAGGRTLAATADWGTANRNVTELLEHALTGRKIRVTSKTKDGATVLESAATEAAEAALVKLRNEFESWIWREPKRADMLVQRFNDVFNTTVPRAFDGRHLTLPGTSKSFNVFDHVKRGAWRIIQAGNTYLAHAVGSGKTFQMVISAMEMKRLGMVKKPMMVVPNHMLQQFASEWQQLYPAARLMVADENNFHMDNRRRFVSRVALSDLDGVIITSSAFKLLDLDPVFKKKMIQEQLDYMRAALEEAGGEPDRLTMVPDGVDKKGNPKYKQEGGGKSKDPRIKQIEKQIENMEQKLLASTSSVGKDKNVRFDEMGVDFLYVDEAHQYRKLDYTTNRQVKGLSPGGSDLAFDLYMKSRYLEDKTPGRSLVMASGTAVTNTVAELYTVQKFLGRQALIDRGIEDFDSWAAMFGREKTALESNASGGYEPVTRFSKFVNVPELTQMFREFADVLTSDHLAALLGDKRPKVEGGSRKLIATPKTPEYAAFQKVLAERIKISKDWKPSRDEPNNPDPIIRIIGDGRLAAIDMRFMDPSLPSNPDSKLNRMISDVIAKFKETADAEYKDKAGDIEPNLGSSMMVFYDIGFGEGVAASRGFDARAWFEKQMREAGIPMTQVAFMADYKKSTDKLKLFKDVNAGRVRILVGSTKQMGTGVNAQQRLKALFHLDSPWYPADLEQREGRIIRQGNKNPLVQVFAYAAKGSYDENMWKMLASKQYFIDQAMSGDENIREIEDLDSMSQYDLISGLIADDPRVLQLAGANAEVGKLQRLQQAHEDQRASFRRTYLDAQATVDFNSKMLALADVHAGKVKDLAGDKFTAKAGGKVLTSRADWAGALVEKYKDLSSRGETQTQSVGEISGFKVAFAAENVAGMYLAKLVLETPDAMELATDAGVSLIGMATRATNQLSALANLPAKLRERIKEARAQMDALSSRLTTPFPMAQMLADKRMEAQDLEADIRLHPVGSEVADASPFDDYSFDDYLAGAGLGGVPEVGMYLSRGQGGSMDLATLQATAARIKAKMPNMTKVRVLASPEDAPQALRDYIAKQGATDDVEGAMHKGELYLFASGLTDAARADHVLAQHEAAHLGLRAILGDALPAVMRAIFNNNADVRKQAKVLQSRGRLSNEHAAEEVIVDIPNDQLVKLQGWRKLAHAASNWLAEHGFEKLSERLSAWLNGKIDDQQRADLIVADLVRAARRYVAGKNAGVKTRVIRDTMLSTLSDDLAQQEVWLMSEAKGRGYKDIEDLLEQNYPLFEKLALLWRQKHPAEDGVLLSRKFMPLASAKSELENAIKEGAKGIADSVSKGAGKATSVTLGRTPHVLHLIHGQLNAQGLMIQGNIIDKVFHDKHASKLDGVTPQMLMEGIYKPAMVFQDAHSTNEFVLVTGIITELGPVQVAIKTGVALPGGLTGSIVTSIYPRGMVPTPENKLSNQSISQWIRDDRGADAKLVYADKDLAQSVVTGNTNGKARSLGLYVVSGEINDRWQFAVRPTSPTPTTNNVLASGIPVNKNYAGWNVVAATLQAKWDGEKVKGQPQPRLKDYGSLLAWIDKHYKGEASDKPMFSRAPVQGTAAERADKIISTKAASKAPLEYLAKTLTQVTGIERLTGAVYQRAGYLLDRYTPETIKAGVISDYGVPQAVIDQRTMLQGRQRAQLRGAGVLIDKLSTLTRAESRVAYEWMNETDPHTIYTMMHNLPEESVKVLQEVQALIDTLSQEAVKLGQLSPDAFARNRFAYLRRSYAKHILEQSSGDKAKRSRVISILGEQYKGRGLSESASMAQVQNTAPDWWKRKLTANKADASLKGEKFIRLERHAASGASVIPLPGMEGKATGKLREVAYWPAAEPVPAKYVEWSKAGTFEVRDVKGANLILWRDFTKDEREKMGEVDEARLAIAKTLHGMIHDVEVGRYLEWLAHSYAKKEGETIPGKLVEASEQYRHTFVVGDWVRVPDSKIAGTSVAKYGKLAGRYLPGPVWNDLRQVVGGQFRPFGDTYAQILSLWKTSKTALSPAVHTNNIMSNFVMADWHDVSAGHVAKSLRILMGGMKADGKGLIGRAGNLASRTGIADREAAAEILVRYKDSGGDIGSWATNEISQDQIKPLLESLEKELAATGGASNQAQVGVFSALQHALMLRLPSAFEAFMGSKPGKVVGTEASNLINLYQSEDDVFRLAAWLKAKEEGLSDLDAGKKARNSFLDYSINAPWIQALRNSALPFISFTYRAVPMLAEIAGKKPHKLMKLMLVAGGLNVLGGMLAGGGGDDEDKERKLLPEEKAGSIWGMVPKLIRMPWNDAHGSAVYLDIRRFIPVGDVFDSGQSNAAIPLLPGMMPGGPMVLMAEVVLNKSAFTDKPITLDTDTPMQKTGKVMEYLYKAFAPNILGLPGTYATTGVVDSAKGKTDAFGREMSTTQAIASSFGVKLGSYPADVLKRNLMAKAAAQTMEIQKNISQLKRQRQTNRIDQDEYAEKVRTEMEKQRKIQKDLSDKLN